VEGRKKMKRETLYIALILCLFGFGQAYGQINLKAMTLPDGKKIEVSFNKTERAPDRASMSARLNYEKGVAAVELSFEHLEPAILFAGDISTYVLWAVGPDGTVENLEKSSLIKEIVLVHRNSLSTGRYWP